MGKCCLWQTIDTRIKLAYALARQWFGVYITPETPNDGKLVEYVGLYHAEFRLLVLIIPIKKFNANYPEWLLDGLAGFLTDYFIKKNLGNNEARYRRYKVCFSINAAHATFLISVVMCTSCYMRESTLKTLVTFIICIRHSLLVLVSFSTFYLFIYFFKFDSWGWGEIGRAHVWTPVTG